MAASVVITLSLDNKGVMTGLKAVGGELDALKDHAATGAAGAGKSLGDLDKNTQKSIDSARLLESTLGVALPRTLTKIIGQSEAFGNVLSAAFNISVVAAMAAAVVVVGGKIAEAALEWGGYTKAMQDAYAANVKANTEQLANPRNLDIARQTLAAMNAQKNANDQIIASETKETEVVQDLFDIGTQGVAIASERVALEKELQKTEEARVPLLKKMEELAFQQGREISAAQAAAKAAGLQGFAAIRAAADATQKQLDALFAAGHIDQPGYNALTAANSLKGTNEVNALATKNAETTRKLREEVVQGWLQGDDLILAKERAMDAELGDLVKHTTITSQEADQRQALYAEQAGQKTLDDLRKRVAAEVEITDQFHAQTLEIVDRAQTRELEGYARLYADEKAQRDKNFQDYKTALDKEANAASDYDQLQAARKKLKLDLDARNAAAEKETAARLQALQVKAALETEQIETAAAIAILPPWERADAEIYASAEQRVREINDLAQRNLIFQSDVAGRTAAVWTEAAGKVTDEWANAFENLFNGGISAQIEQNVKKFAARLAAELTLQSGMGGILAPLLGLPAPGMTGSQYGAAMGGGSSFSALGALGMSATTLGGGSMFGGSTVAAASGSPLLVNGTQVTTVNQLLAGQPSGTTMEQWLGAQPSGTLMPQLLGMPALSGAGTLGGAGGKGLFSMQGLASMIPLGAGFLGGKLGGMPGAIGAGLLGTMMFGPQAAIGTLNSAAAFLAAHLGISVGAAAGLMVGVGGGALGFGIGQQYGTLAGSLSGAGSGALLGLAFGGPIGAIIGGIIGLLGGIFGGLFGGSARRKAADTFVKQQETAVDQIEAQFKSYQVDYPTALTDLEQIRTNAEEQLRKLKGEGKSAYSRTLSPYIDKIEAELKGYEDERERRETLAFAPPQFATGGYTGDAAYGGWSLPPGAAGVVHPREYVFDERTTARIGRGALDSMRAGGSFVGGDTYIFNLHQLDAASTARWLKSGGGDEIAKYARGRRLEGRSF